MIVQQKGEIICQATRSFIRFIVWWSGNRVKNGLKIIKTMGRASKKIASPPQELKSSREST
jgi:hypothetical protein